VIRALFLFSVLLITLTTSLGRAQIVPAAFWNQSRPTPRLISNSYWSTWSGPTYSSTGMSNSGYQINTAGVVNGDLLIVVASIDNGSNTLWPNPIAPGFTQMAQLYFGADGETYSVSWKVASGEPSSYTGVYGSGIVSASATISLIAVSHASQTSPINVSLFSNSTTVSATVTGASTGVTTTVKNCLLLYMSGADWESQGSAAAVATLPTGFLTMTALGDHGTSIFDWTSQQVAYKWQQATGASGAISGKQVSSGNTGTAWTGVIAIAPP